MANILHTTTELSNGIVMPKIGFGTWQTKPGSETYASISKALKVGYRFIDTAWSYRNEENVGDAIRDSGIKRKDLFIQTKLPGEIKTYDEVLRYFEHSLKNLSVEYVDAYLIHAPWPWSNPGENCDQQNREVWRAMEQIYRSGRAKSIGISNFSVHDIHNLLQDEQLTITPMINQIQYYVGYTQSEIADYSRKHGMRIEAYSPLATGRLLDNETITSLAEKYKVTTAQIALRYCVQNEVIPLPKARSMGHIINNSELDFEIQDSDMRLLDRMTDPSEKRGWHAGDHTFYDL
ncbi:aldo/keto reductase [Pediococcus siamensis]|uniref:aldo/keto reductase n=1 Tax=Pediococcus siamensis TaxID=381829 RepID=UPI00399F6441